MPRLRFAVRNAARQEIYSWTAVLPRTLLSPSDAVPFRTRLASPPPGAVEVFGPALDQAVAFAQILATRGVEQGLIGPHEVPRLWDRHLLNCAVVAELIRPGCRTLVDIGSGAGLPGLVIGCALADRPGALVHLVESNAKKSAFLREGVRLTGAAAVVHAERMEDVARRWEGPLDVVCARAVAPIK